MECAQLRGDCTERAAGRVRNGASPPALVFQFTPLVSSHSLALLVILCPFILLLLVGRRGVCDVCVVLMLCMVDVAVTVLNMAMVTECSHSLVHSLTHRCDRLWSQSYVF